MVVRYQLAYEDYRQATVGGTSTLVSLVISWGVTFSFLALLIVLLLLGNSDAAESSFTLQLAPTISGRVRQLLTTGMVGSVLILLPLLTLTITLFKKPVLPWKPLRQSFWTRIKPIVFGVAAGGLMISAGSTDQPAFTRALALVPVTVFVFAVLVFSIANHLRLPWNQWLAQGNIRLPTIMTMSEVEGITFSHAEGTLHYPWTAFKGYRETTNALLLYLSPALMWIIPKRSFSSLLELAVFKQQLAANVREGMFLIGGGGFAVDVLPHGSAGPPPLPQRDVMAARPLEAASMPAEGSPAAEPVTTTESRRIDA